MDFDNAYMLWLYAWGIVVSYLFFENEVDDSMPSWRIWLLAVAWFVLVPVAVAMACWNWAGDRWNRWWRA